MLALIVVRLPRADGDGFTSREPTARLVDADRGRRPFHLENQVAFAVRMECHRAIEAVQSYPTEHAMMHRERGTHVPPLPHSCFLEV
jgi:hypothetical protein